MNLNRHYIFLRQGHIYKVRTTFYNQRILKTKFPNYLHVAHFSSALAAQDVLRLVSTFFKHRTSQNQANISARYS